LGNQGSQKCSSVQVQRPENEGRKSLTSKPQNLRRWETGLAGKSQSSMARKPGVVMSKGKRRCASQFQNKE
jgi:hypothetical protein